MRDREPTIRSRELGGGLRRAMERAGLDQKGAAEKLGWSQSRVSRLLSGKRGGTEVDVSAFLTVAEVTGAERDRLLGICREQNTPGWLQQHGTRLPQQLRTLIDHENKTVTIEDFQPTLMPGLLQTTDYARALIREGHDAGRGDRGPGGRPAGPPEPVRPGAPGPVQLLSTSSCCGCRWADRR